MLMCAKLTSLRLGSFWKKLVRFLQKTSMLSVEDGSGGASFHICHMLAQHAGETDTKVSSSQNGREREL